MNTYDSQETRSPNELEAALMARLPQQVAYAKGNSAYFGRLFARFDAAAINSRQALARLPLTRKSDLHELQRAAPPFGGLTATPLSALARVFASPGPIYDPEGRGKDWWRFARVLFAAGLRPGELVHNAFSYHFTPAGFMLEGAAHRLGCPVLPAGVGQTEMQEQAIADLKPMASVGTPSFLRIIFDKADELGADVSLLRKAVVSGEALPAALRQLLNQRDNASGQDRMSLHCEVANPPDELSSALVNRLCDLTKLRGEVVFCAANALPNDGKVIDDRRKYA